MTVKMLSAFCPVFNLNNWWVSGEQCDLSCLKFIWNIVSAYILGIILLKKNIYRSLTITVERILSCVLSVLLQVLLDFLVAERSSE